MKAILTISILVLSTISNAQIMSKEVVSDSIQMKRGNHKNKNISSFYETNKGNDMPSISHGVASKGSLENGKLMPYYGKNFTYFDTLSYYENRAYTHSSVKQTILDTYDSLDQITDRHFYLMELSSKEGGKLFPHQTHQNGMSVDFMMPLMQDGEIYYGLDTIGADHYWLDFDDQGRFTKDPSIVVDFNLIARHILMLNESAKINGLRITKVIIKIEYKDELFATEYGQLLKASDIYVVQKLTPMVNDVHDEHFHIDFGKI